MDEAAKRSWDATVSLLAPTLTLISVLVGIHQFNAGEDNRRSAAFRDTMLKDDLEFRRKLWLEKLTAYQQVADLAGRIVASVPGTQRTEAVQRFRQAYWGGLILVEDQSVERALVAFYQALGDEEKGWGEQNELKIRADTLVRAAKASLEVRPPVEVRQ